MIRFSSFVLCAALIALPALADEGAPQPLDNPPASTIAPPAESATAKSIDALLTKSPAKHQSKHVAKTATVKEPYEGPDERRMDQELQPALTSDPNSSVETRKLNGG